MGACMELPRFFFMALKTSCSPTPPNTHTHITHTHTQPELLGIDVETAVSAIRTERPDLNVQVLDQDAMYTQDYVTERVRIFEDAESRTVARVPRVG